MRHMLLLITVLALTVGVGRAIVTGQDSVLVFAVDQLANALVSSNQFLLASLYSAERAGVNPADTAAVFSAVRKSRRLTEPAWRAKMAREFARRASFVTESVECAQLDANNATSFTASAFAGESVFLQGDLFVDQNCDGRFENTSDLSFPQFILNIEPLRDFQLLEVVQSTSDIRLKRFITLVPLFVNTTTNNVTSPFNSSTTVGIIGNGTAPTTLIGGVSTPIFFQPGMSALFLPAMAAYQHVDLGGFADAQAGPALYANAGGVEAPISFIQGFSTQCTSGATPMRFNSAPVDNRYALGSNFSGFGINAPAGSVFGQCADSAIRSALAGNIEANLLGGVFFIDLNADGIRNPREVTVEIPGVIPVAFIGNSSATRVAFHQDDAGRFLQTIQISANNSGITTTSSVSTANTAATIAAYLLDSELTKNATTGLVDTEEFCGSVNPALRVGLRVIDNNSLTATEQSYFLNQASADLNATSPVLGITPEAQFRSPTMNVGFTCLRDFFPQTVSVTAFCDADTLSASQSEIVDTFEVAIIGNTAKFQTWATAVTARPVALAPVDATTLYDVLEHGISSNFESVFLPSSLANVSSPVVVVQREPTGLLVDFQVDGERDTPEFATFTFNVSIVTPYARAEFDLNCSGVPGEEIVSEFILTDFSGSLLMTIGQIGAICRHLQPEECVAGGEPTPPNGTTTSGTTTTGTGPSTTAAGTPLPRGPDGTLPIVLIFAGVAIVLIVVMVAIAAQ